MLQYFTKGVTELSLYAKLQLSLSQSGEELSETRSISRERVKDTANH